MGQLSDWLKMAGAIVGTLLLILLLYRIRLAEKLFRMCFGRFLRDHGANIVAAQKSSIQRHNLATGLNAAGLALGIILVFYGGNFSEYLMHSGVIVVFLSIVLYLGFEWVACHDDEQVAQLAKDQADRLIQEVRAISPGDILVKAQMPEKLVLEKECMRFVYPSTHIPAAGDDN
jgi:hypothetical protein